MAVNHFYDETAGHQVVVAAMAEARPLLRSALLGAYIELVSMSQKAAVAAVQTGAVAHHVAGIVTRGDLVAIEPWETDLLVDALTRYNYLEHAGTDRYRLRPHPKLAHWEKPETLAWRAAQRKDVSDPIVRELVRLRDGDQCRCCHNVVNWGAKKEDPLRGTLDHVNPRVLANGDPEALAVACGRCNGIRSDRVDANDFAPLQPPPEVPYYTASTAKYLRGRGHNGVRPTGKKWLLPLIPITPRPALPADTAPLHDSAPSGTPRALERPQEAVSGDETLSPAQRPAHQADTASRPARPAFPADTAHPRDPATSGTPRTAVRPQSDRSSIETRQANSPPDPPDPRTKRPPNRGGLTSGVGKGREGDGGGAGPGPRRRRARRGGVAGGSHGG
ncbi:hypothetical protein LGT39_12495 [Demequina sp. TTPB684]|uniref:hypothetical protein n=1 Tax=unclassified Demequina TaxID=2620311 RepID=UPI001CF50A47|nr:MULTISPECIES: hypothetical protein [unclassified Demequina]MCB2413664.1 hypothetical protein [Demequina sp. TTPB684]UPU87726.1 hypothetical protein LGT36_010750 [Demequina sp. TMPB413]